MKALRKNFKLFIVSIFMFLMFSITTAFSYTPYYYKITLEEGITFVHDTLTNYDGKGNNQEINYIELDFNNPNISLSLVQSNDLSASKETLLNQLEEERELTGKNIVGGVNGEFFRLADGQPLFTTISDGEIFSIIDTKEESLKRPVFYIDKYRNFAFDYLTITGVLKFLNGRYDDLKIDSLNKLDSYNDTNVSTYKINPESTYYPHQGLPSRYMLIELSNSDGTIHPGSEILGQVIEVGEMDEPKKINKNQILITSYGDENYYNIGYDFLYSPVSIQFDIFSDNDKKMRNDIITAFTGHEYLIRNGQEMDFNYYKNLADVSLINNRNARTAIGVTADSKVILFTVDKSDESLGMSLKELSSYLKSLGIINAMNLDGGGSTSISFENNEHKLFLMNDQDKYQRAVVNVISVTSQNK